MPIIHRETARNNTELAIWEIHEELTYFKQRLELSDEDHAFLHNIHPRRAIEWAASRYLLKLLLDRAIPFDCLTDDHGKPYIPDDPREISISHSYGMVSVALSDSPVGIDIQRESPKIERLHSKFISPSEQERVAEMTTSDMHLFWSAKEAMFKLYGRGKLDFRQHMNVQLTDHVGRYGTVEGSVHKGDEFIRCEIQYRFIHGYIWAYAIPI